VNNSAFHKPYLTGGTINGYFQRWEQRKKREDTVVRQYPGYQKLADKDPGPRDKAIDYLTQTLTIFREDGDR